MKISLTARFIETPWKSEHFPFNLIWANIVRAPSGMAGWLVRTQTSASTLPQPLAATMPGVAHEILSIFFNDMLDSGIFEERIEDVDEPAARAKTTPIQANG